MTARAMLAALVVAVLLPVTGCGWPLQRLPEHRTGLVIRDVNRDRSERAARLRASVEAVVGERSYQRRSALEDAATEVTAAFGAIRGDTTKRLPYRIEVAWLDAIRARARTAGCDANWASQAAGLLAGKFENVELVIPGMHPEMPAIVVGAHYDSDTCESRGVNPGADDNASGVAALIELARMAADRPRARTIRFVAFTNEEEPFFHTAAMGSLVYARRLGGGVEAMLSLETLGYYVDDAGSQSTPAFASAVYDLSDTGNYVAVVGNHRSAALVGLVSDVLRHRARVPIEGFVAWAGIPGVAWSDHWSFWKIGVPAVMVTDTAPNRNRCYHRACDVPERLDYETLAEVVLGLDHVLDHLAGR